MPLKLCTGHVAVALSVVLWVAQNDLNNTECKKCHRIKDHRRMALQLKSGMNLFVAKPQDMLI